MTAPRRDGEHESPFNKWIRLHPGLDAKDYLLSVQNNDLWIHKFKMRAEKPARLVPIDHLALVEVKTFMAEMPYAQADTFTVVDEILRLATTKNGRRYPKRIPDRRPGRPGVTRQVRWMGHHVLQMSNDRPDTSDLMLWDGKHEIDEQILVEILRFDRDPDHPYRWLDTRRHHRRPSRERGPDLFIVKGP